MADFLPDRQVVLRHTRRENIICHPSDMFRTARLSPGSAVVYSVHSGPGRARLNVRRQAARFR